MFWKSKTIELLTTFESISEGIILLNNKYNSLSSKKLGLYLVILLFVLKGVNLISLIKLIVIRR